MSESKLEKTKSIVRDLIGSHVATLKRLEFDRRVGGHRDPTGELYAAFLAGWAACFEVNKDLEGDDE